MQHNQDSKRVGIWIRVSTEDQVRGESPETHERRARAYAESKDWQVVELYRLDAISGKTVKEHPEAKRMLADIKSGHITGLVFSKLARLARNTKELLEFAEFFRECNADLISLAEAIDTSTPAGRLFYTMIAAMAQWEREEIASRVAASVPIRAKMGKSLGGQAPYGYTWVDKELHLDTVEAPIRKLMYELFREHKRKMTVVTVLNDRGYRTRNGSLFTDTTIDRLLRDPIAKGVRRTNSTVAMSPSGMWKRKPESEWVHHPVEAIVSEELWTEVNVLLDEKRVQGKRQTKQVVHLFAGFTFCDCTGKMSVPSNNAKYVCKACKNKIPTADLEQIFKEELSSFVFSPEEVAHHVSQGHAQLGAFEELVASSEAELRKVTGEIDKLIELYQAGVLDKAGFGSRYDKLKVLIAQLEVSIPQTQAKRDVLKVALLSQEEVLLGSKDLVERWDTLPHAERRHTIETILERVVIGKGEVEFDFLYNPLGAIGGDRSPPQAPPSSSSSTPPLRGNGGTLSTLPQGCVGLMPFTKVVRKCPIRRTPKTIGEHIREVRLTRGLYVKDVASLLDVNDWTVINWEKGATEPRIADMGKVLSFLGYDPYPPQAVTLPERMFAYRRRQGLSIEAAAKRLGVDEGSWSVWEKGKVPWERHREMIEALIRHPLT